MATTIRDRIKAQICKQPEPAWKTSVFAKLAFRIAPSIINWFGVANLIAFCDAMSILFVSYVDKAIHYFDLNRRFDD